MLITVNIGNSSIGFGLYPDPLQSSSLIIKKVPTHPARSSGLYKMVITQMLREAGAREIPECVSAVVSSVVPTRNAVMNHALTAFCNSKPLAVSAGIKSGLVFKVKEPFKVGEDRIANAVAGVSYNKGRPTAVVDFGTATSITVVGKQRTLLGGAILPGIDLMRKSLHSETAKLPLVSPDARRNALGKDTASSIISGVVYGTAGAVEKLIKMMEKELEFKLQLVLTGGYASLMPSFINRSFVIRPHLTFEGLRLLHIANLK